MNEFPKLMWAPDGVEVTVRNRAQQIENEGKGFSLNPPGAPAAVAVAEPEPADAVPEEAENGDDGPTFGAADDDTYAKRKPGGKKK